ncbi:MAG: transcription elongation factor GreA [Oscillospiraceae bacterium]|nr:transcription elongation factor GreA [Oscillospiraceae bacterium]MBQ4643300.1 transcription elongation factor GreA [Oscillospiraceae bacterium]
MHDELTANDIKKMEEELEYRKLVLRPQILDDVKTARSFGDLSENFEYKEAKRAKGRNDSRIRYLEAMIKTAVIIDTASEEGTVGLFDKVTVYIPDDDEEESYQIVTNVRYDVSAGFVSKESPFGKAVMGKKVGDTCSVHVSEDYSYDVIIRSIEKMEDDDSAPLASY